MGLVYEIKAYFTGCQNAHRVSKIVEIIVLEVTMTVAQIIRNRCKWPCRFPDIKEASSLIPADSSIDFGENRNIMRERVSESLSYNTGLFPLISLVLFAQAALGWSGRWWRSNNVCSGVCRSRIMLTPKPLMFYLTEIAEIAVLVYRKRLWRCGFKSCDINHGSGN